MKTPGHIAASLLAAGLAGCASMINGKTQPVYFAGSGEVTITPAKDSAENQPMTVVAPTQLILKRETSYLVQYASQGEDQPKQLICSNYQWRWIFANSFMWFPLGIVAGMFDDATGANRILEPSHMSPDFVRSENCSFM